MAVPGHDSRDLEFARKFDLPIQPVVQPPDGAEPIGFTGDGVCINSGFLTGLKTAEAKTKISEWLEPNHVGRKTVNYKIPDWLFSPPPYWCDPLPLISRNRPPQPRP